MKKTTTKPKGKKSNAPAKPCELSVRVKRFCDFVASGDSQAEAYLKAGYKVTREDARKHASRLMTNDDVKFHIATLRQPQTKSILSTRDHKRTLAMRIMEDEKVKIQDRLRAMEIDAKLAGHFEPDRIEVEAGPNTLQAIKERADAQRAEIRKRYGYV